MGAPPHRPHHQAKAQHAVCAIVTVSDTRTPESDASGVCIRALLEEGGHRILSYAILPDDPGRIRAHLEALFAALRERMGARAERSVEPGTTVGALWRALVAERPELARILVRFAVNEVYVEPGLRLADGDEVAFFPPVSGGAREAS